MDPEKEGENADRKTAVETPDSTNTMMSEEVPQDDTFLTGFKLYSILVSIAVVGFLIMLDASIVVTAIPRITAQFNSIADVGWYGSAYLISSCALQFTSGKVYEQYSLKKTFLVFFSIFEIGSLICGLASSSVMLIIGRAVAGIGSSGLMNGGFTIVGAVSQPEKRPLYFGVVMGFIIFGSAAGPLLGGVITEDATWRWCFYINLPIGCVSAIATLFITLPNRKNLKARVSLWNTFKRLDPVGFLTFAPFCIMALLALQWGGTTYAWKSPTVIGLFCGSFATLCVFIAWEYWMGDDAMVPLSLLRNRIILFSCMVSTFQLGAMQLFAYYIPVWFQVIKNTSPAMSGVFFMGTVGPQIVFAVVSGGLVSKLGYYIPWSIGGSALLSVGGGLMSTFTTTTSAGKFIGYQVICGVGRGVIVQQPMTAIHAAVPPSQLPIGTAFVVFTQFFGGGIFVALAQTIFTNSLGPALAKFAPGVDAGFVINVGATSLRGAVAADQLNGVLTAYNEALMHTFYLGIGASVAAFAASWGMGWVSVKKVKEVESNE